ncbi:hypothetical protein Tco_0790260 [Tanacetum coccineum]
MMTSKLLSLIGIGSISKVVSSIIGGILSIEARDMDTKLLSAPESNNTLLDVGLEGSTHGLHSVWLLLVAGPLFLKFLGTSLIGGKASSLYYIFSWGGSISPDNFLPSIMLVVIIVAVVIVVTVIVVVVVGEGWANEFHQDKASSVRVPVVNFTLQLSVQLLRENTDSVHSNQRMRD